MCCLVDLGYSTVFDNIQNRCRATILIELRHLCGKEE